jgi:hypothetical protein
MTDLPFKRHSFRLCFMAAAASGALRNFGAMKVAKLWLLQSASPLRDVAPVFGHFIFSR